MLSLFNKKILFCQKCPRLRKWCKKVSQTKRRQFRQDHYYGKPIVGFGDPMAPLFVVGLAPGAHGANRTGRIFTGDRSGDWLFRALHKTGFANQPFSTSRGDGLILSNVYVTALVRCAPPKNKPTLSERNRCIPYLVQEIQSNPNLTVILALGAFAWEGIIVILQDLGFEIQPKPKFTHGAQVQLGPYILLGSYHPSQQNTFTKKLTEPMFDSVFTQAKACAGL
jgi:uracil-DNA glycosylase